MCSHKVLRLWAHNRPKSMILSSSQCLFIYSHFPAQHPLGTPVFTSFKVIFFFFSPLPWQDLYLYNFYWRADHTHFQPIYNKVSGFSVMAFVIDPSLVTDYTLRVGTFQESKSGPSEGTLTILPFSWEHLPSLLSVLLRCFARSLSHQVSSRPTTSSNPI